MSKKRRPQEARNPQTCQQTASAREARNLETLKENALQTDEDEDDDGQNGTRNLQTLKTVNFATRQESGACPMVRWSSRWVGKFRSVRQSVPFLPPGGLSKMPSVAGSNPRGSHFQITYYVPIGAFLYVSTQEDLFPICGEKDIIPYMHTWAHILLPPFSYTKIMILKEEIAQENGKNNPYYILWNGC